MDARIRREALKAAAKVALSVTAIGGWACGGITTSGPTETHTELNQAPTDTAPPATHSEPSASPGAARWGI